MRNGLYCVVKQAVSDCDIGHFAEPFGRCVKSVPSAARFSCVFASNGFGEKADADKAGGGVDKDINDMSDVLLRLLFAVVAACSVFAATDLFTDPQIVPKWLFFAVAVAALGVCVSLRVLAGRPVAGVAERMLPPLFAAVGVAEAAYALLLWCGLWPPGRSARLEGSFDNAAGLAACLCASLPFALLVAVRAHGWRRRVWMAGAGLMAVVAALLLVAAAVGTYRFKQASADGRTLIWRCAAEMVADAPLTGHGRDTVARLYMDRQADYLVRHLGDSRADLAGNVKHLFCEYLEVAVRYGAAGLAAVAAMAWLMRF